ncbi:MAG: hypothetical protein JWM91_2781 [Rhodospirillales bacterium]|nr:hypothetical protein [Rhodospirillales bacterium]
MTHHKVHGSHHKHITHNNTQNNNITAPPVTNNNYYFDFYPYNSPYQINKNTTPENNSSESLKNQPQKESTQLHFPSIYHPLEWVSHDTQKELKEWISLKTNIETIYYISSSLLLIVAIFALYVTRRQVLHARDERLVTTYIEITKGWDALDWHKQNINMFLGNNGVLESKEIRDIQVRESAEIILSFLEDVGHQCRKKYLSINDVADMIGDGMAGFTTTLLPYIEFKRRQVIKVPNFTSTSFYSNTLWLHERIGKTRRFSINGYGGGKKLNKLLKIKKQALISKTRALWAWPRVSVSWFLELLRRARHR